MHIPDTGWGARGSWNGKRVQFDLLGRMVGLQSRPSSGQVQGKLREVSAEKVFTESIQTFLDATDMKESDAWHELEHINKKLGVMEPVPFRSYQQAEFDPASFEGIAFWPTGTVPWTKLRWDQIKLSELTGAHFKRIIVLGSSRICNAPADKAHPYIREGFPLEGTEPTERELLRQWVYSAGYINPQYVFPELPEERGTKPLSLEQQLNHLKSTGQYDQLVGNEKVYVPTNPNALYVPLHARRVLGLDDIWFSQGGARVKREMPKHWWPEVQNLKTTPSGIFRLWVELLEAGCLTNDN